MSDPQQQELTALTCQSPTQIQVQQHPPSPNEHRTPDDPCDSDGLSPNHCGNERRKAAYITYIHQICELTHI